jgi:predicted transcriptional regulator
VAIADPEAIVATQVESGNGLTVTISEDAYRVLDEIAKKRQKTVEEILRNAIAHETWFQNELDKGKHLLLEDNGKIQEVVLK